MAVEMILDIKGVKGESQIDKFEDKIDVFSFSFGASNPGQVSTGTGSAAGKVSLSSISFQKTVDSASPDLFRACCAGKHFETAKLTVREAGGDAPVEYMVIDFTEPFIESISWGAAAGGDKPSESLSISYKSVKITYTSQTAKGSGQKGTSAGWDVKKNALVA